MTDLAGGILTLERVFEFTVFVQFTAGDEDEARDKLAEFLADPAANCYALGVGDMTPREVADDDH